MDGPLFILSILINQIKFANILCDTGCLFYGIVDSKFVTKCFWEKPGKIGLYANIVSKDLHAIKES